MYPRVQRGAACVDFVKQSNIDLIYVVERIRPGENVNPVSSNPSDKKAMIVFLGLPLGECRLSHRILCHEQAIPFPIGRDECHATSS